MNYFASAKVVKWCNGNWLEWATSFVEQLCNCFRGTIGLGWISTLQFMMQHDTNTFHRIRLKMSLKKLVKKFRERKDIVAYQLTSEKCFFVCPILSPRLFFFFKKQTLWSLLTNGWGSTASRLQSHYEETLYFLPLSSQKFLVLIWST